MRARFEHPFYMPRRSIPTGTMYQEKFLLPRAARKYLLQYCLVSYPVTAGVFREIFFELIDPWGMPHVNFDLKNPATANGAKVSLFTSPAVDTTPAAAGDTSQWVGMLPLNEVYPGLAVLTLNIRGALATPNPAFIDILLAGRQVVKGAPF